MEGLLVALYLTGMALVVLFFKGVRIVTDDERASQDEAASQSGRRSRTDSIDRS